MQSISFSEPAHRGQGCFLQVTTPCQIACFSYNHISTFHTRILAAVPTHCKIVKFLQYFVLSKITDLTMLFLTPLQHNENGGVIILFPVPLGAQKHH